MKPVKQEYWWVLPEVLERETGITPGAAEKRRQRGYWQEGVHFKKVNNRIMYNLIAINDYFQAA